MSTSTSYDLDVTCLLVLSSEARETSKNTRVQKSCWGCSCNISSYSVCVLSHFVSSSSSSPSISFELSAWEYEFNTKTAAKATWRRRSDAAERGRTGGVERRPGKRMRPR